MLAPLTFAASCVSNSSPALPSDNGDTPPELVRDPADAGADEPRLLALEFADDVLLKALARRTDT
jgi:hypothetical protein